MNIDAMLRALSWTMPPATRARYLEQWRADAAGAADLGLRAGGVVRGAAMVALTIDRDAPAVSGEPRGARARRLSRRGTALAAAAVAVAVSLWLTADLASAAPLPVPAVVSTLAVGRVIVDLFSAVAIVVAAVYFVAASAAARRHRAARIAFALAGAGILLLSATRFWTVPGEYVAGATGLVVAGIAVGLTSVWGSEPLALAPRAASLRHRAPVALAGLAVVAVVIALGAVDTLVWNPSAKVPGVELAEIYAQTAAADGFDLGSAVTAVAIWAGCGMIAALVVTVTALHPRGAWLTPRRLAILSLGLVAAALFLRFFAGFSIGMSIADTYATTGGDVSPVSSVFALVGPLAFATAVLLFGWAPPARGGAGRARAGATARA